jgi:phosphonopyruvate decarboxylase
MSLDPFIFYEFLNENNINFFTGVPDSLLKEFNNVILEKTNSKNHFITSNEGSSIGLASGYYLSTNKIPLVYLQNSGIGNTINPLMSLASDEVYSIPMLIIVGWRGEPGISDEPQHISQGKCMINLIESLNIPYEIMPKNNDDMRITLNKTLKSLSINKKPHIILVSKNTFSTYKSSIIIENNNEIYRKDAINLLVKYFNNDIILSTTGKISRELMECFKDNNKSDDNLFLNVGAMGHVSMISLGVALQTDKRVVCIDGDGSVIMHMGNLTSVGTSNLSNIIHIVLNNGMHESVGIQPTVAFNISLSKIADSCGYKFNKSITTYDELNNILNKLTSDNILGPVFIEIIINNKTNYNSELSRPEQHPRDRKEKFMKFIKL